MHLTSSWLHCCLTLTLLQSITIICVIMPSSAAESTYCDVQYCLNNSSCRVVTSGNVTWSQCVCLQGWIGERCQARLQLSLSTVTMTTATLRINGATPLSIPGVSKEQYQKLKTNVDANELRVLPTTVNEHNIGVNSVQSLSYSIHYWSDNQNQSNLCNIIQKIDKHVITIFGLTKNSTYTFCAKTQHEDRCNFDLVNKSEKLSYCIDVSTKITDDARTSRISAFYLVLTISIVSVIVILLLAVSIFLFKRGHCSRLNSAQRKNKRKRDRTRAASGDTLTQELLQMTTPPTLQRVNIYPPSSPGKPRHLLVQNRARGYASFTAKNEQTYALSTVMEDGDCYNSDIEYGDVSDVDETELIKNNENEKNEIVTVLNTEIDG